MKAFYGLDYDENLPVLQVFEKQLWKHVNTLKFKITMKVLYFEALIHAAASSSLWWPWTNSSASGQQEQVDMPACGFSTLSQ